MTTLVENTEQKMSFESFRKMFMTKMKELAKNHEDEPIKYFVVINPDDEGGDTVFKNKLFKTTSKYDLWIRVNKLTKGRLFYYDEKYLNEVLYDILYDDYKGEDEFDYSLVTPEQKVDKLIKYVIEIMEEGRDYQSYYWVELKED